MTTSPGSSDAANPLRALVWGRLRNGFDFIKENVVLVGAILYAYVTFVGLLFSEGVYRTIGIDPFNFYEPTDFLLAGLRHPFLLAWPIIYVFINLIISVVGFPFRPGSENEARHRQSGPEARHRQFMGGLLVFEFVVGVLFAVALPVEAFLFAGPIIHECGGRPVDIYLRKDTFGEQERSKLSGSIIA